MPDNDFDQDVDLLNMYTMKKIFFLALSISLALQSFGQLPVPGEETSLDKSFKKSVDYSFSTGTSFYSSGIGKGSSYYFAPEFKLKLSPKFQMDAGIMIAQNRFSYSNPVSLTGTSVVVRNAPAQQTSLFASGIYTANSKLTFTGSVYKTLPGNSNDPWSHNMQMMSLGVKYKLSENVTIGAGMRMVQSNFNPYQGYYSPMYNFSDPTSIWND